MARPVRYTERQVTRMTPNMVKRLEQEARRLGMSTSDYIRAAIKDTLSVTPETVKSGSEWAARARTQKRMAR